MKSKKLVPIVIHFLDQGMDGISPCGDADMDSPVTADWSEVTCEECLDALEAELEDGSA